ncbi:uncharacterized protein CANTADRAFT_268772 [Suhomyces tanzawaensis NRRL Y-17324]|uniref:Uncharacterized protein n=1 Tax=Suhomyces tanzawaensis NRRL Y-17324 TaxID=984487 RepID=A0A1E4SGB8_9ASCO|nr:uncharacterized protein CANTADRAFT_268772 [Suhomyces tanzawaensis NRRL Y-17324]ODV78559.1 hypothetical protein CANTADRAFT_268772 [Suhomyces tanzawaensis NRRL Y-17324]
MEAGMVHAAKTGISVPMVRHFGLVFRNTCMYDVKFVLYCFFSSISFPLSALRKPRKTGSLWSRESL